MKDHQKADNAGPSASVDKLYSALRSHVDFCFKVMYNIPIGQAIGDKMENEFIKTARSVVEGAARVSIIARYPAAIIDSKVVGNLRHATFNVTLLGPLTPKHKSDFERQAQLNAAHVGMVIAPIKWWQSSGSYPGTVIVKVISPTQADYPIQIQLHAGS